MSEQVGKVPRELTRGEPQNGLESLLDAFRIASVGKGFDCWVNKT